MIVNQSIKQTINPPIPCVLSACPLDSVQDSLQKHLIFSLGIQLPPKELKSSYTRKDIIGASRAFESIQYSWKTAAAKLQIIDSWQLLDVSRWVPTFQLS